MFGYDKYFKIKWPEESKYISICCNLPAFVSTSGESFSYKCKACGKPCSIHPLRNDTDHLPDCENQDDHQSCSNWTASTSDSDIPVRYIAINPLTVFIVLILFLIVGATPWLVFSKTKEMCRQATIEAITNTY